MSSYRETMAEIAALFGQKYWPNPPARKKSASAKNGTTAKVLRAVPTIAQGQASAIEIASWTGLAVIAVRQVLRDLSKSGRITATAVGCQPRTRYRYHRQRRAEVLETAWADTIYAYIHRMRGHWLRPTDIRKGAAIPDHISMKRVILELRREGVICYHPLTAAQYQVRWAKSRPCGATG